MTASVRSMSYDHPAYTAVQGQGTGAVTGSGGVSNKFAAFTARLLKSVVLHVTAAGSSADILNLISISGTTTTTTAVLTAGSGTPATGAVSSFAFSTANGGGLLLNQGDAYYLVKGTDATLTYSGEFEIVNQPLAPVTA